MAATDTEQPHALIERRGHVLVVTMNRPQVRNALSGPMLALLRQAWDQVDSDPGIRVCVLTGAGGAFCAGADLKAMTRSHPGDAGSGEFDASVIEPLLKGRRRGAVRPGAARHPGDRGRQRGRHRRLDRLRRGAGGRVAGARLPAAQ